ncbi:hypothetical protein E4N64_07940 [Streptomyces sp. MNU103]|nr:hypothetical protein [Streptomyces sp. MNU103]
MTSGTTARARATAVSALLASSLLLVPLAGTAAAHRSGLPAVSAPDAAGFDATRWSGRSPRSPTGTSPRR